MNALEEIMDDYLKIEWKAFLKNDTKLRNLLIHKCNYIKIKKKPFQGKNTKNKGKRVPQTANTNGSQTYVQSH